MTKKKNQNKKTQKKNFTGKRKENSSQKRSFLLKINFLPDQSVVGARIIFFLFSFWFLGVYNAELLYKLQSYSLFLNNPKFTGETLNQSAGFLIYLSRFLTQFLHYPLLGALFLSLGLSSIELWISRLFKIPARHFYLSFIPPALILLTQTSIGYALYYKFETSLIFSLVLGSLFSLLLFTFYRKIRSFRWGIWIIIPVFFSLFFLIGVYAFVALMMALTERIVNKEKYTLPLLIGALLVGVSLPFISGKYIFQETYIAGLVSPLPNPLYKNIFIFSLLSQLFFLFYPVIRLFFSKKEVSNKVIGIYFLSFCLSLFAIFYFSFRDSNFRLELRLQHLTEKYEWNEMIKEAEKAQEPTKTIAVYRMIALANTNQLVYRLFNFPCQYKPSASVYLKGIENPFYYSDLYFYASFPNIAYLWSMTYWVGSGGNFYFLKQMALCAMLNGEKELASRYFNLLKQSLFHKAWAEEQERYNNDPNILTKNPVYNQIKQYMPEEDFVIPIRYPLPVYYQFLGESFWKNAERAILASLYIKDLNLFMQIMQAIYSENEFPACMQEGLVLYAMFNNNFTAIERFEVNKTLAEKVINCVNIYNECGNNKELAEEKLKKDYQGSYCYFYFFGKPN